MSAKKPYKVDYITHTGDELSALYINGKLVDSGDYYHDKIDDWFGGFKDGLSFEGRPFIERIYYYDDDVDDFPESIDDIDFKYTEVM